MKALARRLCTWGVALIIPFVTNAQPAEIVLTDGLIGAGFGAAIAIALAYSDHEPEEAAGRIPRAAALGALLGMALGGLEVSGAFARYDGDNGRWVWGMPVPRVGGAEGARGARISLFEMAF